jgi:quercetin dioxygenase-like cupin family protein
MAGFGRRDPDASRQAEEGAGATEGGGNPLLSRWRGPRQPRANTPPVTNHRQARVLLSDLEKRHAVIDLRSGETLSDHQVSKRVVMEVIRGRILVECAGETHEFEAGALVTFDPGEHHTERALTPARLIFDLREDGFATRPRPAATPAKKSWFSTAPDWVLCLCALTGILLIVLLVLLGGGTS